MDFAAAECAGCGHAVYPPRWLCPRCHGSQWRAVAVRGATLQEFTRVAVPSGGEALLGTLRTDAGPIVVARLVGAVHAAGQRYALRLDGDVLIAQAETPGA